MAEGHRMTAAQLADKLLASEHADVVRESVAWMVTQLMDAEVAAQIGADGFLAKPFDLPVLLDTVQAALAAREVA